MRASDGDDAGAAGLSHERPIAGRFDTERPSGFNSLNDYVTAIGGVALLTVACWLLTPLTGYAAIALIYLLGVLLSGMILRRGPVLLVAALSAACWNFLFIPPLFTLHIGKVQDALMFLTYFVVAITVGSLTSRLRAREQAEREREQRATALYQFAQKIAAAPSLDAAFDEATAHIREVLGVDATVLLNADSKEPRDGDFVISRFDATFGMLRVDPPAQQKLTAPDRELLAAFSDELANLIERDRLMQIAAKAQLGYQAERLRKALLDCVSHELKTPIAAIKAASQQLLGAADSGAGELARQLAHEIENGSERLNRVVNNLLDMTRLESGVIKPKLEWCEVGELLQGAVESEQDVIGGRQVIVDVPDDLPLALMDHSLIEQAIAKVLANAATYSRAGLPIGISAECAGHELVISVADRGPGLSRDAIERVFEKFYRANGSSAGGLGLGLSIARGFVEAHGGTITAENRPGGGTRFKITVPVSLADAKALEAAS